jgi:NADH:ubiquinone oxidoreductase subunit 4 (subunit M)
MINHNDIILNNDLTYNVYHLNGLWEFETIHYFDFFLDLMNPFVMFFFVINLGFVGFLISVFSTKKFFNSFFCQFLLILIFLIQFFYFKSFINFVTSLNFHPFGIQLNLVNNYFLPFLTEFKYGIFLNVLNYSFVQIVIFLTFICFILILSEKKIVYLNFNDTQKAIKNIFLINLFSINVFLTDNLIYFFFFLECSVFPMVFLIGYFGPRLEKTKAATLYFYVSLISGFFIFFGLSILSF